MKRPLIIFIVVTNLLFWCNELIGQPDTINKVYAPYYSKVFTLNSTLIKGTVRLIGVEFKNKVKMTNDSFTKPFYLFNGSGADSWKRDQKFIKFDSSTSFNNSKFLDESDFRRADFKKDASFENSRFTKVDFTNAEFDSSVDFAGACFADSAHFIAAAFGQFADFSYSHFRNMAYFSEMKLQNETIFQFDHCVLPDTLDFSDDLTIPKPIELTIANFSEDSKGHKHLIFLNRSNISMFHLDYDHFKLLFINPQFKDKHEMSPDEKESVYEQLLNNFKQRGQSESYEALDIEYKRFKAYQAPFTYPFFLINYFWWKFGYNKELIFIWTLGFLLLFTILNYSRLDYLNENVYKVKGIPKMTISYKKGRRWWYSFVYTTSIFFPLKLQIQKISFDNIRGSAYIFCIYILGLICLAYIANFILQK